MKKLILTFLVTCVTSITINQLINNNVSIKSETNIDQELNLNNNEEIIAILNQEYLSKSDQLNNTIKNNLIESITLVKNEIQINYQKINTNLYSKLIYQIILSPAFLNTLNLQYQLKGISFDTNNHINFDNSTISPYGSDAWSEWHWYWFPYWRLHLSANAVTKIIQFTQKLGGVSTGTVSAIANFIATLLSSWVTIAVAGAVAIFVIANYFIILNLQNSANGGWIGIIVLVPGIDWGRH